MAAIKNKMIREMELKGFSEKTIKSYLAHIKYYVQYYKRSPDLLGTDEIKDYLHYLIKSNNKSNSYIHCAYSALKFLYFNTLDREWDMNKIPRLKRERKLPNVLSREEVQRIFDATHNIKHKAMLMTTYGAGLRVSEVARLKVIDIDSSNMQIIVRQGKGKKDRYTPLSQKNLSILRKYWFRYRPHQWLFPGVNPDTHISERTVQRVFEQALNRTGINKKVSIHSLRHSFATHLLESGVSINHIQILMGHTNIGTTNIYIHLAKSSVAKIESPLDILMRTDL